MDRTKGYIGIELTDAEIADYLREYYQYKLACLSKNEAVAYLEVLTLEFLLIKYEEGNSRIKCLVNDLLLGIGGQQAA